MGRRYTRTPQHSAEQQARTKKNQIKFYDGLLQKKPDDKDAKIWKKKLETLQNKQIK